MSKIALEGMNFFAYHGCFPEEKIVGTHFIVDLHIAYNTKVAEQTDALKDTLDYQSVYRLVSEEMQTPSNLLEHIGRRILKQLKASFPDVEQAQIKIRKLHPPLGGQLEAVSLTLDL